MNIFKKRKMKRWKKKKMKNNIYYLLLYIKILKSKILLF